MIRKAVQVPENLIFSRNSVPFHSVSSFGIGSSAELGMPRNEHFLPRNNGNRSEPIPRNFSEQNSVPNPTPTRLRRGYAASTRPSPPAGSGSRSQIRLGVVKAPVLADRQYQPAVQTPRYTYADPYQELQDILLCSCGLSISQRMSKWLDHWGCGNNRPSVMWGHLTSLQPATVKEI